MNTPADIWKLVLGLLQGRLQAVTLDAWFDDLTAVEFKDDTLLLHTPDKFKKEIIDERYLQTIKDALRDLFSADINVIVTTGDAPTPIAHNNYPEDEYTFEQFIVGSSNKFAHAAATAVANNPAKNYNPLFIYGQSGLGKTHLLYAIANVVRRDHPSFRIIYIKGEDFTNELVNSIGAGQVQEFRDKYRLAALLLVDDIQFVAGKDRTQEEFFHTFNALYEANKQIVLTSDRPPKEIHTLEDRLKTRFEWGLLADIQPPDYETRMAIIKNKAALLGVQLPDDISSFIAENLTANVRQIEGALNKLLAYRDLLGNQVDGEAVSRAVKDMLKKYNEFVPSPSLIIEYICRYYDVDEEQVRGQGRKRDLMEARQTAMYLIRRMTNLSLNDIGKEFGDRDHTTVLHSLDQVEKKMRSDPAYAEKVKEITTNINNKK